MYNIGLTLFNIYSFEKSTKTESNLVVFILFLVKVYKRCSLVDGYLVTVSFTFIEWMCKFSPKAQEEFVQRSSVPVNQVYLPHSCQHNYYCFTTQTPPIIPFITHNYSLF